jgi:hypothetical protein
MRLWTIHPKYLDSKGLVAAWREALLAQKVLAGETRGYINHPQLTRFRAHPKPRNAIAAFLIGLAHEAAARNYNFDTGKITSPAFTGRIDETAGQLEYEWRHLKVKLRVRSPALYRQFRTIELPETHPLFRVVPGGIRDWEKRIY